MSNYTQVKYTGATPGTDALTYSFYDSTSGTGAGGRVFGTMGLHKCILDLKNSQAGTLKAYKSQDRGANWSQIYQSSVAAAAATSTNLFEFIIEPFADWKLEWVNGGVAQATWLVDVALSDQRAQAGGVTEGTADTSAAAADATANPTLVGRLAYMMGFNGTTWDRVRTAIVAKTATFTGILNSLIMGRYNASPPALTDGDVQLLQLDVNGALRVSPAVAVDDSAGVIKVEQRFSSNNITTQTTTVVKSGAGMLHAVTFNKMAATGVVTVYDNTAAAGTIIATITMPAALLNNPPLVAFYDVAFSIGCTVVTGTATQDITVSYR